MLSSRGGNGKAARVMQSLLAWKRALVLIIVIALAALGSVALVRGGNDPANEVGGVFPFTYSTFMGGDDNDGAWGLAADAEGNMYVVGSAMSLDFPTTPGAFNRTAGTTHSGNGWVMKFDKRGQLAWSTFFGGNQTGDQVNGVAVDDAGHVYIAGIARGQEFPTTEGAYDRNFHAGGDAFVACLDETGSELIFSTFLGGSDYEFAESVAIDAAGAVWVMGVTSSPDFPTTPDAFDGSFGGMYDVFLAELSPDGSQLLYSTYLGGSSIDSAHQMVLDDSGSIHIAGYTESSDFPTTSGALSRTKNGLTDGFVTKFKPGGRTLDFSTYIGGDLNDWVNGLDVGAAGAIYVTGHAGLGFPVTPGAFDTQYNAHKTFAAALDPNGTSLLFSTYLGGTISPGGNNGPTDGWIIREAQGRGIWVGGSTESTDFVTTPDAFDSTFNYGFADAFLSLLSPDGSDLLYSTYIGGEGNDEFLASALGPWGELFLAGRTGSTLFPTTSNAFDTTENGGSDGFLLSFVSGMPDLAITPADIRLSPLSPVMYGTSVLVNATVLNMGENVSAPTSVRFYDGIPPAAQIGTDQPLDTLAVDSKENVSVTWIASPRGTHTLCVVVDPDDLVAESDESNNLACVDVTVVTLPDLIPEEVELAPPSPLLEGTSSQLSVRVLNQGDTSASAFDLVLFDDANHNLLPDAGELVNSTSVSGLIGHSRTTVEFSWPASTVGNHSICAYVDPPPGVVTESDETNNVACVAIEVLQHPDDAPVSVGMNYKPIIATAFASILLAIGLWSSKRKPWKTRGGEEAVSIAFGVFSLPFVLAEAGTGAVSFLTGQLSIPPVAGVGTVVDLAILTVGISVSILRAMRARTSGQELATGQE